MDRIIIPIASGKGGVGKSFLAANISIALARLGKKVIAADLDFGGSNLHTCFGMHNTNPGIGDYLRAKSGELEDLLVKTNTENLQFLAGDARSPFMANMPHVQKLRLAQNLRKLNYEFLILDLGSGSTYNTLDFFGMTRLGMLVATPEHTSIMNMLTFLKLFAFRIIERTVPKNKSVEIKLKELYNRSVNEGILTVSNLLNEISEIDKDYAEKAKQNWVQYRPRIVFNKCEAPGDLELIKDLQNTLEENLMLHVDFFGCLYSDFAVPQSFFERKTLNDSSPSSFIQDDINLIANRIIRLWKQPIRNSSDLLIANSNKIFKQRQG
tara:strand:- start:2243 stop:3214 length:972 start_codon:yes stop_codon:yes gene_type:complete